MRYSVFCFSKLKLPAVTAMLLLCTACNDTFNQCIYGLSEGVSEITGVLCQGDLKFQYEFHDDGYWTNTQPISTRCEHLNIEIKLANGDTLMKPSKYLTATGNKSTDYNKYRIERDGTLIRTHWSWRSGLKTCPAADIVNFTTEYEWAADAYGIQEVEKTGRQSDRLIDCSENDDCPEQAQTLFWVAANALSKAGNEALSEPIKFPPSTTTEEIAVALATEFTKHIRNNSISYDLDDPDFIQAFNLLNRAHKLGSAYAPNELGVLFMKQEKIQDLSLAKTYFNIAIERGDPNGDYNLAKIARLENPDDHRLVLEYLKTAAASKQGHFEQIYFLGLQAYGTDKEKVLASKYFKKTDDSTSLPMHFVPPHIQEDFESDFGSSGRQQAE